MRPLFRKWGDAYAAAAADGPKAAGADAAARMGSGSVGAGVANDGVDAATGGAAEQKKPLPSGWVEMVDPEGDIYYGHPATKRTQWERPDASS